MTESVKKAVGVAGHDIPSLDGLRAASIAIVILSHAKYLLPKAVANSGLFRYLIGGGLHGVQIFFAISGYLITTLLVREFERSGDVSLRRFYLRRTLRIFPPFYVYLAVLAVLWACGVAGEDRSTFLSAATYTIIYHPHPQGWLVQHAWSLSIEEQFYLLWPAMLLLALRSGMAKRVAYGVLALMPMVRCSLQVVLDHYGLNATRAIVNCSAIDCLMIGCLLALLAREERWRLWCRKSNKAWTAAVLMGAGLVLVPYAELKLQGTVLRLPVIALAYSVTAICIGAALEYVVRCQWSVAGRILNARAVRHIGVISYSIYLWQQLFTGDHPRFGWLAFPLMLAAAELSFWLIERPVQRLRFRLAL